MGAPTLALTAPNLVPTPARLHLSPAPTLLHPNPAPALVLMRVTPALTAMSHLLLNHPAQAPAPNPTPTLTAPNPTPMSPPASLIPTPTPTPTPTSLIATATRRMLAKTLLMTRLRPRTTPRRKTTPDSMTLLPDQPSTTLRTMSEPSSD